jgi:hypothetical protein
MGLNNVTFIKGKGGLGRPLPGEDHYSGLLYFNNTLPSGFTSSSRVKLLTSITDAEDLGIDLTYGDETAATGSYQVTTVGTNGDTVELKVTDYTGTVSLGIYTKVSGDSTATLVATAIKNAINALTYVHGYTATSSTDTVTITAKAGKGIVLNSGTPITATYSTGATIAGTITQFTGGVAGKRAIYWHHISEFFRMNPKGILYVGIYAVPASTYTWAELQTMDVAVAGKLRQVGIYADGKTTVASADLNAIQTVCNTLETAHMPLSVLYACNISGVSSLTSLINLQDLSDKKVSVNIDQSASGFGYDLWKTTGQTISNIGAVLGAMSFVQVSQSIAWTEKVNFSDGTNCESLMFGNGDLWENVTDSTKDLLNDYHYIFLRKFIGLDGSYANSDFTAINDSSDYSRFRLNRTIDKAIRVVYAALLPKLASPLDLNSDGTLKDTTVADFEEAGNKALNANMGKNPQDLSSWQTIIDPSQDVLGTNNLEVSIELLPIGCAENITVTIGFVTKLS